MADVTISLSPAPRSSRLLWLDFLRGLAVLGMVEAHSVNSFLDPIYRTGPWFALVSYLNGWVAPTFLFIAGLLQGAALRRNWASPKPLGPRLRSLGVILLMGYALQFPWDALIQFSHGGREEIYHALGKIDVLHCLAVSLAFFLILAGGFKKFVAYELTIFILLIAVVFSGPYVWQAVAESSSTNPLLGYLAPSRGALFPLFSWSGFVAAGVLASRWVREPIALGKLSLGTAAVGWLLSGAMPASWHAQAYAIRCDVFCFRLSLVLASGFLCAWAFRRESPPSLVGRMVIWCGAASLGLYVWHLILLHSGLGFFPSLISLVPKNQKPPAVVLLFLATLAGSVLLTWGWQSFFGKIRTPKSA